MYADLLLCVLLRAPLVFLTSDSQIQYVSAQMLWAGSSYLPYEVKGSVSNIHGCETIKSWCDNRGVINAETEPYSNINSHPHGKKCTSQKNWLNNTN